MSLQMVVFNTDFRLEGVTIPKESLYLDDPADAPQIVVSQPWIESKRTVNEQDVGRFLSKEDFVPVPHSFYGWVRPADGVVVLDASPDNFIMSSEGLVPIDLQINVFTPTQLREAGFNVIWDRVTFQNNQEDSKAPLRLQYQTEVESLKLFAEDAVKRGANQEEVARQVYAKRNELKQKYRDLTPPDVLEIIDKRNLGLYGNTLGPTIEHLQAKGKTWQNIIDSASRWGGHDLDFRKKD